MNFYASANNSRRRASCSSVRLLSIYTYTVSQKKGPTVKLSVTLSNLNRFSKFLHYWKAYQIRYKIDTTPPHLRYVATLPWEIKNSNFLQMWKKMHKSAFLIASKYKYIWPAVYCNWCWWLHKILLWSYAAHRLIAVTVHLKFVSEFIWSVCAVCNWAKSPRGLFFELLWIG